MHAKLGDDSTKLQGEILYRLFLGVGGSTCIKFGKDAGELWRSKCNFAYFRYDADRFNSTFVENRGQLSHFLTSVKFRGRMGENSE